MGRRSSMSIQKRIRERKKAEKKAEKQAKKLGRAIEDNDNNEPRPTMGLDEILRRRLEEAGDDAG